MNKYNCKPTCPPIAAPVEVPVFFNRTLIEASRGDETGPEAPYVGKFRNTLVVYEASDAIYLFSSDGNFTFLGFGFSQMTKEQVERMISDAVGSEAEIRSTMDELLAGDIAAETAERKEADTELAKPMVGATSSTDGKSGMVPAPEAGDEEKALRGDGTWGDISSQTIFYANSQETGNTRHIYKDAAFTQAASAQDILDANEGGTVVLRITINPNPNGLFSDAYIQNTYVGTDDYQFLFLDEKTYREYDASTPSDTTFYYSSNVIQSKLTAGTNIDITNNVISASIPIDTNYSSTSGNPVANSTITNSLDRSVVTDMAINATPSTTTVSLDETKTNLASPSSSTTTTVALPVASGTQAGIMNKATYDSLTQAIQDIANIKSEVVAITGLPANPTQQELTTAWMAASGETALINGAGIYDTINEKRWTYYSNDTTWHWLDANASIHVQQWTNSSAGIAKGSTVDGQIYAESDGTGSVNGWDTLTAAVGNNTSKLATIEQGAEVNVQADWTEADSSSDAYIQNKPSLATVATTGDYGDLLNTPTVDTTLSTSSNNAISNSAVTTKLEDASFIGSTIGQPSSLAYVGSANIQDGAVTTAKIADLNVTEGKLASNSVTTSKIADGSVTSDKIDFTTLWSGDSVGASITLSESPTNYKYLIFNFRNEVAGFAPGSCKIPTASGIRYTVSTNFTFENGGVGIDCIQYSASGNTLDVRYQGYTTISASGAVATHTSSMNHITEIIGTDIDV